jgi:hypothetical protein
MKKNLEYVNTIGSILNLIVLGFVWYKFGLILAALLYMLQFSHKIEQHYNK